VPSFLPPNPDLVKNGSSLEKRHEVDEWIDVKI